MCQGGFLMKTVTLNNGVKMPVVGFGVYKMADLTECEKSVLEAIEAGYRLMIAREAGI